MSKHYPPDDIDFNSPDKEKINNKDVLIYRVIRSESVGFKLNNIYFEIHKMAKSKSGGRVMRIVAWKVDNSFIKFNLNGDPLPVKDNNWKFKVYKNKHVYMLDKKELVKIAINILGDYTKDIIKDIFK
jgi:hypothetical protein